MKKSRKRKKSIKNKKTILHYKWLILLALTAVLFLLGGMFYFSTLSVLTDHDAVPNQFGIADLRTEIEEGWEDKEYFEGNTEIPKEVKIKNKGTQPILVRVMLLPSIMGTEDDDDAIVLPASYAPPFVEPNDSAILDLTVDDIAQADYQWKDGGDGYFYYLAAIDPGSSSQKIIDKVQLITAHIPEDLTDIYYNANMKIEVKVEAIGLSKYAYRDAFWKGAEQTNGPLKEIDEAYKNLVDDLQGGTKTKNE